MQISPSKRADSAMMSHLELSVLLLILSAAAASVLRFDTEADRIFANRTEQTRWRTKGVPNAVSDPEQCERVACPPFTLEEDRGTYQLRYYAVAPYARSSLVGNDGFLQSTLRLYGRLHDYFNENNDKKEALPMTAPVILRMNVGDKGLWEVSNYTMFFYIDPKVKSPPKPNDDTVEVVDVNAYEIYIRTFSGYPVTYGDWIRELLALQSDLERDGQPHVKTWFYFASYDNPLKFTDRVNEVQILKPHK